MTCKPDEVIVFQCMLEQTPVLWETYSLIKTKNKLNLHISAQQLSPSLKTRHQINVGTEDQLCYCFSLADSTRPSLANIQQHIAGYDPDALHCVFNAISIPQIFRGLVFRVA